MVSLYIVKHDETGDFYLTDDKDHATNGEITLTEDEYKSYTDAWMQYEDWQLFIAKQVRRNHDEAA